MLRILCQLFCVFTVLILNEVAANDVRITNVKDSHPYDVLGLHRRFQNSLSLKDKSPTLAKYLLFNSLDRDFLLEQFKNLLETSKCSKDIAYTIESLSDLTKLWSWYMLDSFAKPPDSGILQGNFYWVGDYNECMKVYAPPKAPGSTAGNFYGQYCTLAFDVLLFNRSTPLKLGVCLPDSCSQKDFEYESLLLLLKLGGFPVSDELSFLKNATLTCMPRERRLSAAAISVIALLSVFCAFALVGSSITVVKYFKKLLREERVSCLVINITDQEHDITDQDKVSKRSVESDNTFKLQNDGSGSKGFLENCEAFLNCFCMFTNGEKLLNTDSSEGQLLCIHGIRFLSMSWVILGHSYSYLFGNPQTRNLFEYIESADDFLFQIILQGIFSVDSFFVLSGFLLSYLVMKEFSKSKGSINWVYFYIHRYIRLTPIYMIVLGFSASVYFYLGSGPYRPLGDSDPNCQKNWWWNLLYINNFVGLTEQCMLSSWYLANDMQFFVISPIFLISLWRWPKVGYSLLGLFLLACMLSSFFITYHYDLIMGLAGLGDNLTTMDTGQLISKYADFFDKIYLKPYTRIGPYLIGIITGYLLFKHRANNRPKLGWASLCIGWIVASAATLSSIYGLYHTHPSLVARSMYNAFSRTCFGFGLSWVIYVCLTNQSDIVNSILSYKLFIPLSRLTYSAYLIHPMIVSGYFISLKQPFEFSHPSVVCLYLGFMVVTYALALPVSLILESPIVSLEKFIRNKFQRKKTK